MEYYLSEYIQDGPDKRIPHVAEGSFTSIDLGDYAVVALSCKSKKGHHLCDCPRTPSEAVSKILGRKLGWSLGGLNLATLLAEILLHRHPKRLRPYSPPIAWTAFHGPDGQIEYRKKMVEGRGERYQIWLGNELIWSMPCLQGGLNVTDDFNRPNESPLSTGTTPADRWTFGALHSVNLVDLTEGDPSTGVIQANELSFSPSHAGAIVNSARSPFGSNQFATVQVPALIAGAGPLVRGLTSENTYYYWQYFQHVPADVQQDLFMYRRQAGTYTVIGSFLNVTNSSFPSAAAILRLEASGSTLTGGFQGEGYPSMTTVLTVTDTNLTDGNPGFDLNPRANGSVGARSTGSNPNLNAWDEYIDAFSCGGDVSGAQFGQPLNC